MKRCRHPGFINDQCQELIQMNLNLKRYLPPQDEALCKESLLTDSK